MPLAAWRSRKARELVRVLVARRGRAVARDELAQLLWPDEPGDRVAHRLSVALSEARAVLDPGRRAPVDHFIAGDTASLALNRDRLTIDAETSPSTPGTGWTASGPAGLRDARAALDAAERAYAGDFLDNEPYDDHAAGFGNSCGRASFRPPARWPVWPGRPANPTTRCAACCGCSSADPYDERPIGVWSRCLREAAATGRPAGLDPVRRGHARDRGADHTREPAWGNTRSSFTGPAPTRTSPAFRGSTRG